MENLKQTLIDYSKRLIEWGICLPDDIMECVIDEHIESINERSNEAKAVRQNEQTKEEKIYCDKCFKWLPLIRRDDEISTCYDCS